MVKQKSLEYSQGGEIFKEMLIQRKRKKFQRIKLHLPVSQILISDFLVFGFVFFCLFVCFCFLGPHALHMEVPSLGVNSEIQLPAYTTATAMHLRPGPQFMVKPYP